MDLFLLYTVAIIILTYLFTSFMYKRKLYECNLKIEELTIIDRETGIYTRNYFNEIFISEFHRARRLKYPLALILVKSENSKMLSNIIHNAVQRETDIVAEFDKDIIVALLFNTDANGVDYILKKLNTNMTKDITYNIGVHAAIPDSHTSSITILNEAFKALQHSISSGENKVEFSLNSV